DLGLTDRQLDVLALMMQGKNNKSICRTLNLAEPTVKNHVTAILKALKVTNRTEAVIAVTELGWRLTATPEPSDARFKGRDRLYHTETIRLDAPRSLILTYVVSRTCRIRDPGSRL